jgi:uncharacterized membrane protein
MSRHRALGYGMVALAATLFAINGTVSKVILGSGVDAEQLTEVRCAGALLGLMLIALTTRQAALPLRRSELPLILALGIVGLALVQWSYFYAIHRIAIGVALVVQFVGPILVALWARFVYGEHVRARIWVALVLALCGLLLIVEIWQTRRPAPRPDLALGLGLLLRHALLVTRRAVVELPERPRRERRVAARQPRCSPPAGLGADALDGRPRHDRPLRARRRSAAADQRDPGRDHGDARAGRRDRHRLGMARGVAEPVQISGAAVTLAGVALALSSR